MQQLLAAGLDHVRIPVDPAVGGWLPERMAPPDFLAALRDAAGRLLLIRRPESGLLGGMLALPGTPWRAEPWTDAQAMPHAPAPNIAWEALPGLAQHGFTHRELTMRVLAARVATLPDGAENATLEQAARSLPTAMRKLLTLL